MWRWLAIAVLALGCGESGEGSAADLGADVVVADSAVDAAADAATVDAGVDLGVADLGPDAFRGPLDDSLRLNHVQAKGTHNSYHLRPETVLHPSHDYEHAPLDVQLEAQGVRQFELDTHAVIDGAFDVLHIPGIDPETSCLAFAECLTVIKRWSDAHPGHLPIMVWIEPKDVGASPFYGYETSVERMVELDGEILAVWPRERVFTPDDLRGAHDSLPAALAADGWPTLGAVRGKIIFSMLDGGDHRDAYREGALNLAGRVLFVQPDGVEDPAAAFFKINNGGSDRAAARVRDGFIVTSNVDSADSSAEDNAASRAAALANGVHYLSSDMPAPAGPGDEDWLEIPGGTPARCNPVTAPDDCTAEALE